MSGDDTTSYAPKSPDLSSFYPTEPAEPQQVQRQMPTPQYSYQEAYSSHTTSQDFHQARPEYTNYNPQPSLDPRSKPAAYNGHPSYLAAPPHQIQPQRDLYPQNTPGSIKSEFQQPFLSPQQSHNPAPLPYQSYPAGSVPDYGLPDHHSYQSQASLGQPYFNQSPYPGGGQYLPPHQGGDPSSQFVKQEEPAESSMPRKKEPAAPAAVLEPSPVKTKFPTARIKRIMQADEEVGKVAQQTPIAVGKALEMFMVQMVSRSADMAKEKGSKRVTATMLKQVVESDEQWDFLREIVSKVSENEKEGVKGKAKTESESEEDSEPKKKVRGGGRRKKAAA